MAVPIPGIKPEDMGRTKTGSVPIPMMKPPVPEGFGGGGGGGSILDGLLSGGLPIPNITGGPAFATSSSGPILADTWLAYNAPFNVASEGAIAAGDARSTMDKMPSLQGGGNGWVWIVAVAGLSAVAMAWVSNR